MVGGLEVMLRDNSMGGVMARVGVELEETDRQL